MATGLSAGLIVTCVTLRMLEVSGETDREPRLPGVIKRLRDYWPDLLTHRQKRAYVQAALNCYPKGARILDSLTLGRIELQYSIFEQVADLMGAMPEPEWLPDWMKKVMQ